MKPTAPLPPPELDHLVYATRDLGSGIERIQDLLGVHAAHGGRHPQWGTRNAILSLGPGRYLEIIAPDPDTAPPPSGVLFGLDRMESDLLLTWVVRCADLDAVATMMQDAGARPGAIMHGERKAPDGRLLQWSLTDPAALPADGAIPFLINWGTSPHPSGSAPPGGALDRLAIHCPDADAVTRVVDVLGIDVPVLPGNQFALEADIIRLDGRRVTLR